MSIIILKGLQILNFTYTHTRNMVWNTTVHIIPSLLGFGLIPLAIVVNKKLYNNIKNEEHLEKGRVIQSIIKAYALVQCIACPCIVGAFILGKLAIDIIQPEVARHVVSSIAYIYFLYSDYVSLHSLVLALCRYTFVIFDSQAVAIGIAKLRAIFIGSSIGVPIISALISVIIHPLDDIVVQWFYDQGCPNDSRSDFSNQINLNGTHESPGYLLYIEYCPESIQLVMKVLDILIVMMIYSNIPEGFMYTHLFLFSKRYKLCITNSIKI